MCLVEYEQQLEISGLLAGNLEKKTLMAPVALKSIMGCNSSKRL